MHVLDRGVLYDAAAAPPHERFASFSQLERRADGRLVASFRVGSSKDSADEDVRAMLGDASGAAWHPICHGFGDVPPGRGRMRGFGVTRTATGLLAALTWIDRSDATRPLADPLTQGILDSRVMVAHSADGAGWSTPQALDLAPYTGCVTTGAALVLHDGRIAVPYESWKAWGDARRGEHRAALALLHAADQRVAEIAIVAHDPTGRVLYWDQRVAVAPADGRLVAMFWSHDRDAGQDLPIHIAWGTPDGRTWSAPRDTGIVGQICTPLPLPDGRLLALYVHRHDPPGLRAILSDDGGQRWDHAGELEFYRKQRAEAESGMGGRRGFGDYWADMSIWTFGHPVALLQPDGTVLVAYYAGDATHLAVHWARLAL